MTVENLSNPVVAQLVEAINAGDRQAFLDRLTADAVLTDDGTTRVLTDWIDREIFTVNGRMTVDHEEDGGLVLRARFTNDRWGEMSTVWRFTVIDDRISRIDTGQA